jgi:hypothetical protein
MTAPGLDLSIEDFRIGRTFDLQDANQTTLHARERVVD